MTNKINETKDYIRKNTFKGWIKHIYLVIVSLLSTNSRNRYNKD